MSIRLIHQSALQFSTTLNKVIEVSLYVAEGNRNIDVI